MLDASYSDSFFIYESWIVVSDNMGGSIFAKFMKVDFIQYEMFESKIQNGYETGIKKGSKNWRKFAGIMPDEPMKN